ncbi:MAG: translation initiation factor 2 [Desulfovibrio sp.]|uniref:translation initiation factor 2 n=1 Tax=Desulfovibrio sp. TaxID=885 RepID=UPI00135E3BDE|nr:translation initiation factor 2 [Desulfovibrio sp.]MTJ92867.1 translation initiation factor 2 [Desulfovibrio sp.]
MKTFRPTVRTHLLLVTAAMICLIVATPRPCAALAISKGLPFYAQDMEFYYQHQRVESLPGILRTFDSQGVLHDSLKQIMLAAFLGQVLRNPEARQRLLPPPATLSRDGRRTLAWAVHFAQLPDEPALLTSLLQPSDSLLLDQIRNSPASLTTWDIYSEKSVLQMYWAAFMATGNNDFLDVIIRAALRYARLNAEGLRNEDGFSVCAAAAASLYEFSPRHVAVKNRVEQFLQGATGAEAETLRIILRR